MGLLDDVTSVLAAAGIPHALIGAAAMAVHGISRSTVDQDLLVTDPHVLHDAFWSDLAAGASVDVRRGDADDPLAGVVRIDRDAERIVDVVVGRGAWQDAILARAATHDWAHLRVVEPADLILLKLYAGGVQDKWDVEQLLATYASLAALVDSRIATLPPAARALWTAFRT
jgi:hypothetical protein